MDANNAACIIFNGLFAPFAGDKFLLAGQVPPAEFEQADAEAGELVVADLVLLPPGDGEKQHTLFELAEGEDHAIVKVQCIREFFVVLSFQRLDRVEVQAAAQVGDALARHQAEQGVEAVVTHHAQGTVPLDAAALHEAGAKAAIIVFVRSIV